MADHVAEALRLRTWALRVLSEGWTAPPDVEMDAWRLFLRAERCALPLSTRAEGDGPPLLHAVATVELQRILSARAQLQALGRAAARAGLRIAVLKGGLHALPPARGVDLDDVDVLAEPGREGTIAILLEQGGYRTVGTDGNIHLATRATADAIPVEVHFAVRELSPVNPWPAARGIPDHQGLWQLSPLDHARHVLWHAVITHPYRRSVLRDLLVIAHADGQLTDAERTELEREVLADQARLTLLRALDGARRLRDGIPAPDDFGRADAAAHYLLLARRGSDLGRWMGGQVSYRVFAGLGDRPARRAYWRRLWAVGGVSPWGILARLEGFSPPLGRWTRRVLRLLRAPLVNLIAMPVVRRARRLAGRAGP